MLFCRTVEVRDTFSSAAVSGFCSAGDVGRCQPDQAQVPHRVHCPQEGRQSPDDLSQKVHNPAVYTLHGQRRLHQSEILGLAMGAGATLSRIQPAVWRPFLLSKWRSVLRLFLGLQRR
jgi:hypothetical protein